MARAVVDILSDIEDAMVARALFRQQRANILEGGIQQYGLGSQSVQRYNTDINVVIRSLAANKQELRDLNNELIGRPINRQLLVILRH